MSDSSSVAAPAAEWAQVEIFGHRKHYGRIEEVERFGAKMVRIDEPTEDEDRFITFFYGGASIFSLTPVTEETARAWHARFRPRPVEAQHRLPAPTPDDLDDDGMGPD